MLIKSDFEVAQPVERVWEFFNNIPQVAKCLPGTELTNDLGSDKYQGKVAIRMGPVKLQFTGTAQIKERDAGAKRLVVDATGADESGRGQAALVLTATLAPTRDGTKVDTSMDLQISGAAAQYGRGMVSDVTAVLMRDFGTNAQNRIDAVSRGLNPDSVASVAPASGFGIALRATRMALFRVIARFVLPYQPSRVTGGA
ncbi:MAG TPA: SRPBCC family protein [Micromonosporaceae bacterium]|jgi:hypothetical protein